MRKAIRSFAILGFLTLPFALSAHRHSGSETEIQKADHQLAGKIQKSIETDEALSAAGHNVAVTVRDGVVTLKGAVQSDAESQEIEGIAEDLAIQTIPVDADGELVSYPVIHNEIAVSSN